MPSTWTFYGFELVFEHRFEPDLPPYVGVVKGPCHLHLSEHYDDASTGSAIRTPVHNVLGYATALRAKAFGKSRPGVPSRLPWKPLKFTVTDTSRSRLTFYTEQPVAEKQDGEV